MPKNSHPASPEGSTFRLSGTPAWEEASTTPGLSPNPDIPAGCYFPSGLASPGTAVGTGVSRLGKGLTTMSPSFRDLDS